MPMMYNVELEQNNNGCSIVNLARAVFLKY